MKTVFVTGATGFIGSRVVERLCRRGLTVRCLLRPGRSARRLQHLPVEYVSGDLSGPAINVGMTGADACIHLAGPSGWAEMRRPDLEEIIVGGTRRVAAAALAKGLRLVFVSSAAAINGSDQPIVFDERSEFRLMGTGLRYAIAKHDAEREARALCAKGLDLVVVNPAEVYGPADDNLVTACNLIDFLLGPICLVCTGGTAICHVDDVADGIVAALTRGVNGERYILGGDNVTIEELARMTLAAAGTRKTIVRAPNKPLRLAVRWLAAAHVPLPVRPEVIDYATRFFFVSSKRAEAAFGYSPRPARAVIEDTVSWLARENHVRLRR